MNLTGYTGMTNRDLINAEIQRGNSVRITLRDLCNQDCSNELCMDAGVSVTYDVLHQGSWSQCIMALEDLYNDGRHRILQHCSLSIADMHEPEDGSSVTESLDGFMINMDDGSYLFVDRSNIASVMTYPKPGAKTIIFNNDAPPKKRKLFGRTVIKNIKSP